MDDDLRKLSMLTLGKTSYGHLLTAPGDKRSVWIETRKNVTFDFDGTQIHCHGDVSIELVKTAEDHMIWFRPGFWLSCDHISLPAGETTDTLSIMFQRCQTLRLLIDDLPVVTCCVSSDKGWMPTDFDMEVWHDGPDGYGACLHFGGHFLFWLEYGDQYDWRV